MNATVWGRLGTLERDGDAWAGRPLIGWRQGHYAAARGVAAVLGLSVEWGSATYSTECEDGLEAVVLEVTPRRAVGVVKKLNEAAAPDSKAQQALRGVRGFVPQTTTPERQDHQGDESDGSEENE